MWFFVAVTSACAVVANVLKSLRALRNLLHNVMTRQSTSQCSASALQFGQHCDHDGVRAAVNKFQAAMIQLDAKPLRVAPSSPHCSHRAGGAQLPRAEPGALICRGAARHQLRCASSPDCRACTGAACRRARIRHTLHHRAPAAHFGQVEGRGAQPTANVPVAAWQRLAWPAAGPCTLSQQPRVTPCTAATSSTGLQGPQAPSQLRRAGAAVGGPVEHTAHAASRAQPRRPAATPVHGCERSAGGNRSSGVMMQRAAIPMHVLCMCMLCRGRAGGNTYGRCRCRRMHALRGIRGR